VEGSCEHGNEPSDSIQFWEIPKHLSEWLLLKDSAAWTQLKIVGPIAFTYKAYDFVRTLKYTHNTVPHSMFCTEPCLCC
jgi:hypothetical protein